MNIKKGCGCFLNTTVCSLTVTQGVRQITKQQELQDLHYDSCDRLTRSPRYVTRKQR